jgi:methionyl-tRNA formyltransferase
VCQPDRPAGRGLKLTPPPAKVRAAALGLPVVQPTKLRTSEFAAWVHGLDVDVALVVAYGRILPKEVLSGPRTGCVNVHASLLPKYRGAAPIAWALVNGETETGITLMKLDEGMDTGPTFARVAVPVGPDDTAADLARVLAGVGADAVREWLPGYVAGRCTLEPQDDSGATTAPLLRKSDGAIPWSKSAKQVHDHVRGMNPWPGAFTIARGRALKVHSTRAIGGERARSSPGQIVLADKTRVLVACGKGCVELLSVQPEGRRAMSAAEWIVGRGAAEGDRLGG